MNTGISGIMRGTKYSGPAVLATPRTMASKELATMRPQDTPSVPYGYCHCGCGEKTAIAHETIQVREIVAGEPHHYIRGHGNRKPFLPIRTESDRAYVPLRSKGIVVAEAIIDLEDIPLVSGIHWHLRPRPTNNYAAGSLRLPGESRTKTVVMHRYLMWPPANLFVDHKNRNGLDNRRANLRIATKSQNCANSLSWGKTSIYRGVHLRDSKNPWQAGIRTPEGYVRMGPFATEIEAAKAYDEAARQQWGEFAALNFPEPGECSALWDERIVPPTKETTT